ncbi:MAG: type II toxin-antitoxin system antitoxin, RelB/DinJ family, partial [Lachnospiraceae bacterium]|nr:type II toxin-antitoxin system antitoxin, RelB/DinJ family [Lachnospiraceae bacterium]
LNSDHGTSLEEAVRIFARQSVIQNGMPFMISTNHNNTYGRLARYADPDKRNKEDGTFEKAMVEQYGKTD